MYEKLKRKRHLPPRRREDSSIFRYIPHSFIKIRIFEGESDGWNLPVEQGSNTFTSHCAPNRPVTQCKRLSSKNNRHSRSAYSKKKRAFFAIHAHGLIGCGADAARTKRDTALLRGTVQFATRIHPLIGRHN